MSFREAMLADLDAFLNVDEFATIREFCGVLMKVSYQFYRDEMSGRVADDYMGLHGDHVRLTFRASDFLRKKSELPREKERVTFRGKSYTVDHSESEFGMCRLELSRYRGRKG